MTQSEILAAALALEAGIRERAHGASPAHVWGLVDALKRYAVAEGAPRPVRKRITATVTRCRSCGRSTTRTICTRCTERTRIPLEVRR